MKLFLSVILIFAATFSGSAQETRTAVGGKNLGEFNYTDKAFGKAVHQFVSESPKLEMCVVVGTNKLNEQTTMIFKAVYDRKSKHLIFMRHRKFSTLLGLQEDYSWRIWYDVTPDDFKEGLPYSNEAIKIESSEKKTPLPVSYSNPKILEWP